MKTILLLVLATGAFAKEAKEVEPLVATTCDGDSSDFVLQYHHHQSWQLDASTNGCINDKLEILKQCQRLYPAKDITNIVEFNGKKLANVCRKKGGIKCGAVGGSVVTVYRCLESPFQSDALLVPSPCIFDHIHNASSCWDSRTWNKTALDSCAKRDFTLKSYAVLLPCGVGLFTGVEFVCCPPDKKVEDDYDDGEDEEDDYYFDETTSTTTTTTSTTTTTKPPFDTYFRSSQSLDPLSEHTSFKQAENRLESLHRLRMSKVMRDWENLESQYQTMKSTNEKEAEDFKRTVTVRFQKTIKNLEEEGQAEKRQLLAVHQQRVLTHLNEKKKEAMECYTGSLNQEEINVNRVRKCLEKLMRVLHKDRHHTISHYRHLVKANEKQAEVEEDYTLQRLVGVGLMARQAVGMLERYPSVNTQLRPLIEDYVLSLQGRDDISPSNLLTATHESEIQLLKQLKGVEISTTVATSTTTEETVVEEEVEKEPEELDAFREQIISVRREVYSSSSPLYFTVGFAAIAVVGAVLVGIIVVVKRRMEHPRSQGFLEVNQSLGSKSPEEKHVVNMQINGYENPTYKYFT